jgi:hypothetical protein
METGKGEATRSHETSQQFPPGHFEVPISQSSLACRVRILDGHK